MFQAKEIMLFVR